MLILRFNIFILNEVPQFQRIFSVYTFYKYPD